MTQKQQEQFIKIITRLIELLHKLFYLTIALITFPTYQLSNLILK